MSIYHVNEFSKYFWDNICLVKQIKVKKFPFDTEILVTANNCWFKNISEETLLPVKHTIFWLSCFSLQLLEAIQLLCLGITIQS